MGYPSASLALSMGAGRCPFWSRYTPEFAIELPSDSLVAESTKFDGLLIQISPWILHSTEEARSVLRHAIAHRLVALAVLQGSIRGGRVTLSAAETLSLAMRRSVTHSQKMPNGLTRITWTPWP